MGPSLGRRVRSLFPDDPLTHPIQVDYVTWRCNLEFQTLTVAVSGERSVLADPGGCNVEKYEKPQLIELGDLRALTAASKMTVGDDMEGGGDS